MALRLVPQQTSIPFLNGRRVAFVLSAALVVASLALFFMRGLNLGIDFVGGSTIEMQTPQPADVPAIRRTVNALDLGDVSVQLFGEETEVLIRFEQQPGGEEAQQAAQQRVESTLLEAFPGMDIRSTAFIGPKISAELARDGTLAVVLAILAVLVYIWFRFEWQFGLGAVIALVHDVLLTVGFFAVTQLEFNLSIIAAILTIVGYSLNDTVVVYDRVRENIRKFRKMPFEDLLNHSLNDTLSRTIMTSLTTLLALFALFFFGGAVIRGFTAAMIWGVVIGTYSSVFVASPILMYMKIERGAFIKDEDGAEASRP